jgi:hypothetical protein
MKTKNLFFTLIVSIGLMSSAFAQIPTNGLVAYWPFNGNAIDESNNNNNGTVYGATLTADRFGNPNSAYYFNGINNYIEVMDHPSLNPANITLAAWVKAEISSSHTPDIIRKSTYSNASNEQYILRLNTDTDAQFQIKANTTCNAGAPWTACIAPQTVALNEWVFMVGTFDSTALKLYVNGVLVYTTTIPQAPLISCGSNLRIGTAWNNYPNYFKGAMDNLRIYDRALNQSEITALFNENICFNYITVTDTLLINVGLTGFNPITYDNTIKIFPNPSHNQITIDNGDLAIMQGHTIKIVNTIGQTMFTSIINQQQFTCDLSTWTGNGLYFVHIIDAQGNTIDIKKIVLQ